MAPLEGLVGAKAAEETDHWSPKASGGVLEKKVDWREGLAVVWNFITNSTEFIFTGFLV